MVVVGSDKDKIARELEQTNAVIVENVNWNNGMGTSIRCAVQHLIDTAPNVEAIARLVCDQPFVDSHTIEQLVGLREKTKKAIVSSSYAGTLGVPALFHRSCADELLHLDEERRSSHQITTESRNLLSRRAKSISTRRRIMTGST